MSDVTSMILSALIGGAVALAVSPATPQQWRDLFAIAVTVALVGKLIVWGWASALVSLIACAVIVAVYRPKAAGQGRAAVDRAGDQ